MTVRSRPTTGRSATCLAITPVPSARLGPTAPAVAASVASARGLVIAVADRDRSSESRPELSGSAGGREASTSDDPREAEIAQLRSALASRDVIGQAKGVLMVVHGCSADAAFAMLRARSQRTNVKLRDVAAQVVTDRRALP